MQGLTLPASRAGTLLAVPSRRIRGLVVARADNNNQPGGKVLREFREEDGTLLDKVTAQASQQAPLYADDVSQARRAAPPKDNMSREMKDKLRKEYLGLGGSENSVLLARRPPIIAVAAVEERPTTAAMPDSDQGHIEEQQVQASPSKVRSRKWKIDENEVLHSTMEHRLWTWGPMAIMLATGLQGAYTATGPGEYAGMAVGLLGAYLLSDLGTGIFHWGLDNYGDANSPFFGRQIAAFQGHHQRPWTITEREFCNNVHQVFKPAAKPALFFLLISPWTPAAFDAFISSFIFLVCMSQQFHAWSHMKKSELHPAILALQDAGLLISRKAHGLHHRPPFDSQYCIVSGMWNDVLDKTGFFVTLEKVVHRVTGVEPRSWHDTTEEWQEQERPTTN